VTFPDGTELLDVPVTHRDLIADLALLGPVSVDVHPVRLIPREDLPVGSDVYLIGYPLETEAYPTPTIARGILSRIREWPRGGLTFFQTDASIAGGQSGGVLATDSGEVIGVSGLAAEGSAFGLAASALDVAERLERMKAGEDTGAMGDRMLAGTKQGKRHTVELENIWATASFFAFDRPGTSLDVRAVSKEDVAIYVLDAYGEELGSVDDYGPDSVETLRTNSWSSLRYIQVEPVSGRGGTTRIESSLSLTLLEDPDDAQAIELGAPIHGHIDAPFDYDYFLIELEAGDRITALAESVMIDPYLFIDRDGEEYALEDDDSGGGLLGLNAMLTFEASESGTHLIVVADSSGYLTGGYILDVSVAGEGVRAWRFEDLE